MEQVKVLFDYNAEQPDELSIKVGDILEVVSKEPDGWWEVGNAYVCVVCVCVSEWVSVHVCESMHLHDEKEWR